MSPSVSPSLSPSESPSVSPSVSPSESPSLSPSTSESASPSAPVLNYSRGSYDILPLVDDDLETLYSEEEITAVEAIDGVYVEQAAGEYIYSVHQFRDELLGYTNGRVTWVGKSTINTSISAVYLQVFNQISQLWETLASCVLDVVDEDVTITAVISGLSSYLDDDGVITCRVYQEEIG